MLVDGTEVRSKASSQLDDFGQPTAHNVPHRHTIVGCTVSVQLEHKLPELERRKRYSDGDQCVVNIEVGSNISRCRFRISKACDHIDKS